MKPVILRLEPARVEGDTLELAASLEHLDGRRCRLWWRLPAAWSEAVTPWADPFVVGLLFPMMQWRCDVLVEGRVSPSLLTNLEAFMGVWRTWFPAEYQPVRIRGREEVEAPPPGERGQTIVPFSCGVDSGFTVFRHRRGLAGRRNRNVTAGVVMHGFDITLGQENSASLYRDLVESARIMLGSIGVACIPMASNFRELPTTWGHSFCTHLVSGLRLLAGRFDAGMLPNSINYTIMRMPWGSHPVSDRHLSSRHFEVLDDGADFTRCRKVEVIRQWPEAMRHLHVCFENPDSHANCCRCEKCVRTILSFRVTGLPLPPAFAHDVTDRRIRRTPFLCDKVMHFWLEMASLAKAAGLGRTGWARAIAAVIRRSRRRMVCRRLKRRFVPVRDLVRRVFRGSPLSRRELAERASADRQRPSSDS